MLLHLYSALLTLPATGVFAASAASRVSIPVSSVPLTNSYTQYTARAGFGCPTVYYDLGVDIGLQTFQLVNYKTYIANQTKCGSVISQDEPDRSGTTYHVVNTLTVGSIKVNNYHFDVEDVDPNGVFFDPIATGYLAPLDTATFGCPAKSQLVAFTFAPIALAKSVQGEISFCQIDPKQVCGEIAYFPYNTDYTFSPSAIKYGNTTLPLPTTADYTFATFAGLADSDLSSLPVVTFNAYRKLTGAVASADGQTWTISKAQFSKLKTLTFVIGGVDIPFIPDAQVRPYTGGANLTLTFGQSAVTDFGNFGPSALDRVTLINDISGGRAGIASNPFTKKIFNYRA